SLCSHDLLQDQATDVIAKRKTVGFRLSVHVIGMNKPACAGHILDNNRRRARNVFAHVPANGPTVCVKTPARCKSYEHTKRLSFVESVVASRQGKARDENTHNQA